MELAKWPFGNIHLAQFTGGSDADVTELDLTLFNPHSRFNLFTKCSQAAAVFWVWDFFLLFCVSASSALNEAPCLLPQLKANNATQGQTPMTART